MTKIRTLYEIIAEKNPSEIIEDLKAKLAKYEAIGTPEELEFLKKDRVILSKMSTGIVDLLNKSEKFTDSRHELLRKDLNNLKAKLAKYEALGTPEECEKWKKIHEDMLKGIKILQKPLDFPDEMDVSAFGPLSKPIEVNKPKDNELEQVKAELDGYLKAKTSEKLESLNSRFDELLKFSRKLEGTPDYEPVLCKIFEIKQDWWCERILPLLGEYQKLGTPEELESWKTNGIKTIKNLERYTQQLKEYTAKQSEQPEWLKIVIEKAKKYDEIQESLAEAKKRLDNYKESDYGPIDNTNDASAKTDIKNSAIQLLGLNIEFEKENTVEQISQKTYLTITAAEFIKDKYDQLVKTGIDLYHDSIAEDGKKIPVYRPNAARVLIREKEWMNEFFTKFLVRDSFKEPEAKKLLDLYNTRLWEAVQEQLKQFFVNLPEFRALSDLHKQDLEKCVKNSPDNGGSERLWNGLKYLESLESALEAERHRCKSYFNSIWGL